MGISVFLARKSDFLMRKQLFNLHNLSTCSNFFAKIFQLQNRDSPFPFKDVPSYRPEKMSILTFLFDRPSSCRNQYIPHF
jgi:hypothetical protein